jgi:predicted Zn-ribbon and HTH transcriptional regulator
MIKMRTLIEGALGPKRCRAGYTHAAELLTDAIFPDGKKARAIIPYYDTDESGKITDVTLVVFGQEPARYHCNRCRQWFDKTEPGQPPTLCPTCRNLPSVRMATHTNRCVDCGALFKSRTCTSYRCPDCKSLYRTKQYNITAEDYRAMYEKQGGHCAICGKQAKSVSALHIDHSHHSNEVRGLLCSACNTGLGQFGDNMDLLLSAAAYLARYIDGTPRNPE